MCLRKSFIFGEDVELKAKNKQKLSLKSFQKAPKLQLLHKNLKIFGDCIYALILRAVFVHKLLQLNSMCCFHCAIDFVAMNLEGFSKLLVLLNSEHSTT